MVKGQRISQPDLMQVVRMIFSGFQNEPTTLTKLASAMPSYAPLVWYAGKDTTGKPVDWVNPAATGPAASASQTREFLLESLAAQILTALEAGQGGPTWQRMYLATPSDPASREDLGRAIALSQESWSNQTVAHTDLDRKWIFANVVAGMPRAQVYTALHRRGYIPTNRSGNDPLAGVAVILLPGAFEPGCSFSNDLTFTFDSNDRLFKIDLSQPIPDCL